MNYKIRCIREKMKLLNAQGLIISNPVNIRYLIGIPIEGTILITDKENVFITDARYIEEVNNHLTINDEFIIYDNKDLSDIDYQTFFKDCENVGFEENYVTFAEYENLVRKYRIRNIVETEKIIEKQRMIKDEKEISYIEKACEITDKCFEHLLDYIKIGMTEKQVAFEIEKFFADNGADGLAFDSIVASGINSSKPHAIPSDKIIRMGDPITIDFGAKYKGYCAEIEEIKYVEEDEELEKTKALLELETLKKELAKMEQEKNQVQVPAKEEEPVVEKTNDKAVELPKEEKKELVVESIEENKSMEPLKTMEDEVNTFEQEQEENAIISVEELTKASQNITDEEIEQYEDDGNEPISIKELEAMYKSIDEPKQEELPKKTEQEEKLTIPDFKIKVRPAVDVYDDKEFKNTPVISPVYGLKPTESNISLEQTANLDKLNEEIRKTNEFLSALKELRKNLE